MIFNVFNWVSYFIIKYSTLFSLVTVSVLISPTYRHLHEMEEVNMDGRGNKGDERGDGYEDDTGYSTDENSISCHCNTHAGISVLHVK